MVKVVEKISDHKYFVTEGIHALERPLHAKDELVLDLPDLNLSHQCHANAVSSGSTVG
jgi:hypothetical protein